MNKRSHDDGLQDVATRFVHPGGRASGQQTIGQRIRQLRKLQGMTQVRLAELVETGQSSISRWEKDEDEPNRGYREKLAQIFGVSEAELHYGPQARASSTSLVPVVGYVGAGDQVFPIDDHELGGGLDEVDLAPSAGLPMVAVRVRGDSMLPTLRNNWLVFYTRNHDGVPENCINRMCVVKVAGDGPTLVKEVRRGYSRGRFNLVSSNASPIEDVVLDWAAKVMLIQPA
jgi:transcriptional regulator with XRE-family HTH domain